MVTVYRVEHKEYKHGPYRSHCMSTDECRNLATYLISHASSSDHPIPYFDGLDGLEEYECCGFASLAQLFDWFGGWITDLEKAGYHVAVFEVDDNTVRYGDRQLVFQREDEEIVESISLMDSRFRKHLFNDVKLGKACAV